MLLLMVMCFYFISSFGMCKAVIKISEAIRMEVHGVWFFVFGFGVFFEFWFGVFCLFCCLWGFIFEIWEGTWEKQKLTLSWLYFRLRELVKILTFVESPGEGRESDLSRKMDFNNERR